MKKESQKTKILNYLRAGNSITPLEALNKYGCFRLSERIREIEATGIPIIHGRHVTSEGKRVGKYWLAEYGHEHN